LLIIVTISVRPTIGIRIPTDVIGIIVEESNAVWFVVMVIKRKPHPAVNTVMSPNAVVISSPTPWVVGNPSITIAFRPVPISVLVGNPLVVLINNVCVRTPVTNAVDDNPTTLAIDCDIWIKSRSGLEIHGFLETNYSSSEKVS
jgi:hypothetical protein